MAVNKNTKTYVLIGIIIALLLLVVYFIFFRDPKIKEAPIVDGPVTKTDGIAQITDFNSSSVTVRSAINQQVQPAIINEAISVDNTLVNVPKKATSYAVLDATDLKPTLAITRATALNRVTLALKSK